MSANTKKLTKMAETEISADTEILAKTKTETDNFRSLLDMLYFFSCLAIPIFGNFSNKKGKSMRAHGQMTVRGNVPLNKECESKSVQHIFLKQFYEDTGGMFDWTLLDNSKLIMFNNWTMSF
jgi:hypothetical protein